ncbi:hypothetical protein [Amycolatopsis sp. NPDC051102]|uniref:hypothetical protein n=1 Tax=Amycolatopsis sp. NPDC051102 TaxID=3155163 RepID=UPI003416017E
MTDYLAVYLRDQLALGVTWRALARRARDNNKGTPLGGALAEVEDGIAEDVRTFEAVMRTLGIRPNPAKVALAAVAERFGRLKRNGRWVTYSPLSRFLELEGLAMGIEGKKILWHTLGDLAGLRDRLPDTDFDELLARAARQRQTLEPFRRAAGTEAFARQAVNLVHRPLTREVAWTPTVRGVRHDHDRETARRPVPHQAPAPGRGE